jgi:hypothetical protein
MSEKSCYRPLSREDVRISGMEWALWAFFAVMLGLFVWSSYTAKRDLSKKVQPFVDDLFDSHPRQEKPTDSNLPK